MGAYGSPELYPHNTYCKKCGQPRLITVTTKKSKLIIRYLLSVFALFLCIVGVFSFPDFISVGVCFLACGIAIFCLLFKHAKNDRALMQKVQDANLELIKQHALDRFKDDNPPTNDSG